MKLHQRITTFNKLHQERKSTPSKTYKDFTMAKNKGNKKTRQAKKDKTSNTGSSSESSDNMEQDQKNTTTLEMEISDRVDSLRMLEDIRKEISQHIKKLRKMIN